MLCKHCGHDKQKVIETRKDWDRYSIMRRRMCLNCNYVWITFEQESHQPVDILKVE